MITPSSLAQVLWAKVLYVWKQLNQLDRSILIPGNRPILGKPIRVLTTLTLVILISACSSDTTTNAGPIATPPTTGNPGTDDDPGNTDDDPGSEEPEVETPVLESVSSEFLITGETMVLEGENFLSTEFDTMVILDGEEFVVDPISDTEIEFTVSDDMPNEAVTVSVQVSDGESEELEFFVVPLGWYQIPNATSEYQRGFIFDDSNELTVLADSNDGAGDFEGEIQRLVESSSGYEPMTVDLDTINPMDLLMETLDLAAFSDGARGFFTNDRFASFTNFGNFDDAGEIGRDVTINFLDDNSVILANCCGAHIQTSDQGSSHSTENLRRDLNSFDWFLREAQGQASDGYYYQLGQRVGAETTNYVVRSRNGYSGWEAVDLDTPYSLGRTTIFHDTDLVFTITSDNTLQMSTDLARTWTNVRSNVQNIFVESDNEWYITTNEGLLSSDDAGATWEMELELPAGSEVNHLHFSESKAILSGKNLLFVRHD